MVNILSSSGWELDEASLGNWERGDRNISLENLCRLVVFFSLVCRDDPNAPPHTFDGLVVFASDRKFDGERDQPVPVKYILLLKRVFALCANTLFLRIYRTYVLL